MVLNVSQVFSYTILVRYADMLHHKDPFRLGSDVLFRCFLIFLNESVNYQKDPKNCPTYDMPHDMLPILGPW